MIQQIFNFYLLYFQVFLVEQINFHRKMADKLEKLYHDCWPNVSPAENTPAATTTMAANTDVGINQWDSNDIYEEVRH